MKFIFDRLSLCFRNDDGSINHESEELFKEEYFNSSKSAMKRLCIIFFIITLFFYFEDYSSTRSDKWVPAALRFVMISIPLLFIAFVLRREAFDNRNLRTGVYAVFLLIMFGVLSVLTALKDDPEFWLVSRSGLANILLVIAAYYAVVWIDFRATVCVGAVLVGMHVAFLALFAEITLDVAVIDIMSVVMLSILGAYVNFTIERLKRQDFNQRRKITNLTESLVPKFVVPRILERKPGERIHYDLDDVTILFADMVGSSELAEQLQDDTGRVRLLEFLDRVFSTFDNLTVQRGMTPIKTIGDGYMAVAGADPASRGMSAQRRAQNAVRLGLDLIEAVGRLQPPPEQGEEPVVEIKIRVGINSGKAIAGVIGEKKISYDIWGRTVNLASRMESTSRANELQISETTYKLLGGRFAVYDMREIEVKGHRGKIKTYFVKKL